MHFELNPEQSALQDSLARLLADQCGFEQRRAIAASAAGHSPALWQQLAALGVTALPLPEAHGGFGGGAVDLLPVMTECGRALVLEPLLASCVLGATALAQAGDDAQQARWLPAVAEGRTRLAWAHDETPGRHAPVWTETRASVRDGGWLIDGHKALVLHAVGADQLIVSARLSGAADDAEGRALFLVDAQAPGLCLQPVRLVDDTPAADVHLAQTPAQPLGDPMDFARASAAIGATLAMGLAAVCADMVGSMEAAHALTLQYLNTRKQFGRVIGENQALRHRAAEMQVSLEMARSMAIAAAVAVDHPAGEDSAADLHRAKLVVGRHARNLCQLAIQLHGGIGMTEEYAVGHCLRRVHVMDHLFGDVDAQAAWLADLA